MTGPFTYLSSLATARCVVRPLLGLLAVLSLSSASFASHAPSRFSLEQIVQESDLVFRGVVQDIQYVLSQPGEEQLRVPFTFVTYRVTDVLRGSAGSTVTLQFIGGVDPRDSRLMSSSITPRIDLGDEDILFVQGNTKRQCPLVGDIQGRFRVVNGQVYTEMGNSIVLTEAGTAALGPQYRLPEVETLNVLGREFRVGMDPATLELPSNAVDALALSTRILRLAESMEPAPEFDNADPTVAIAAPDMKPAAPPVAKAGEESVRPDLPNSETKEAVRREQR
ncbi:MAG: hypothetical protein AB7O52_18890 [Planctomycetota bacterium]